MPFAYVVPWSAEEALDKIDGTRLAVVGRGWEASRDPFGGPGSLLARKSFDAKNADPELKRPTPEGWTYYGTRAPLEVMRRKEHPRAIEYKTIRGGSVLLPIAELAPMAIDFMTGETAGHADEWARRVWRAWETREEFQRDGIDYWKLSGPIIESWATLLLSIQATHHITAEALTDTREMTTGDLCPAFRAMWGYGDSGK